MQAELVNPLNPSVRDQMQAERHQTTATSMIQKTLGASTLDTHKEGPHLLSTSTPGHLSFLWC
jgi:hypothetical protein